MCICTYLKIYSSDTILSACSRSIYLTANHAKAAEMQFQMISINICK